MARRRKRSVAMEAYLNDPLQHEKWKKEKAENRTKQAAAKKTKGSQKKRAQRNSSVTKVDKDRESAARFQHRQERMATRSDRPHWSTEYAIYGYDSWGKTDLGQEGGHNSVRSYSGGSFERNRQRH